MFTHSKNQYENLRNEEMLNVHSSHHNKRFHMEGHVEFEEQAAMGVFDTHVCISKLLPVVWHSLDDFQMYYNVILPAM